MLLFCQSGFYFFSFNKTGIDKHFSDPLLTFKAFLKILMRDISPLNKDLADLFTFFLIKIAFFTINIDSVYLEFTLVLNENKNIFKNIDTFIRRKKNIPGDITGLGVIFLKRRYFFGRGKHFAIAQFPKLIQKKNRISAFGKNILMGTEINPVRCPFPARLRCIFFFLRRGFRCRCAFFSFRNQASE